MYPATCISCNDLIAGARPVCPLCLSRLEHADPEEIRSELQSFAGLEEVESSFALWQFDDGGIVQALQHRLKYGNAPYLGVQLGRTMGAKWLAMSLPVPDCIVPVPLSAARYLDRGYNQSTMLARGMSERLGVEPKIDILSRSRRTRSQTSLDRSQRWNNVSGAFSISEGQSGFENSQVLLVDDVFTSGATLAAAAQPLLTAGARVSIAALAYAR